jgi:hypothetical protein
MMMNGQAQILAAGWRTVTFTYNEIRLKEATTIKLTHAGLQRNNGI